MNMRRIIYLGFLYVLMKHVPVCTQNFPKVLNIGNLRMGNSSGRSPKPQTLSLGHQSQSLNIEVLQHVQLAPSGARSNIHVYLYKYVYIHR